MDESPNIQSINEQFTDLYNKGDIDTLVTIFAEKAMVFLPGADIIKGRDNIKGAFHFMKRQVASIRNTTLELSVEGQVAIEVGRYEHFDAESREIDTGKFLVVWRRSGDNWLIDKDSLSTSRR